MLLMLALVVQVLLLSGCTSLSDKVMGYQASYANRDLDTAANLAAAHARQGGEERHRIYWLLEQGKALHEAGEFEDSIAVLREAIALIELEDGKGEFRVSEAGAAILWNDTVLNYRGRPSERVMLHLIQSLNYLAIGEYNNARVERNRMFVAQSDATQTYAKGIELAQQELAMQYAEQAEQAAEQVAGQTNTDSGGSPIDQVTGNSTFDRQYQKIRNLITPAYRDFENPLATYYWSLLAWAFNESGNAANRLRRVASFVPENEYVQADIEQEGWLKAETDMVYILAEVGLAPRRRQVVISYVTPWTGATVLALPVLDLPGTAIGGVVARDARVGSVDAEEKKYVEQGYRSQLLADLRPIVANEYDVELPSVILRSVLSLTLKEAVTAVGTHNNRGNSSGDELAQAAILLGGTLWKVASAEVDLRGFSSLGQRVELIRMPRPASGELALQVVGQSGQTMGEVTIELPEGRATLVWARSVWGNDVTAHAFPLEE